MRDRKRVNKRLACIFGFLILGSFGGCATFTKGTTQLVTIDTPGVPKANCTLESEGIGTKTVVTPASISLPKSKHNISVMCSKECYSDGIAVISSNTEAMVAGNIIAGGLIGLGIDAATGALNKYTPQIQVAMQPVEGCKPKAVS